MAELGRTYGHHPAGNSETCCEPWTWHLMPERLLYPTYLASVKEPRMGAVMNFEDNDGWKWDLSIGAEYRRLAQEEASDARDGFLGEVMWWGFDNVGIGVGYNFTDFSSDLRFNNEFSEYGWFLRLQGVY